MHRGTMWNIVMYIGNLFGPHEGVEQNRRIQPDDESSGCCYADILYVWNFMRQR